ncbi:MAG: hypothetical protein WCW31_03315 [Patescibacteria group bacterium]
MGARGKGRLIDYTAALAHLVQTSSSQDVPQTSTSTRLDRAALSHSSHDLVGSRITCFMIGAYAPGRRLGMADALS